MSLIKIKALENIIKCRMVHTKTGLFYNGYEANFSKQKNTLSPTNSKIIIFYSGTVENEIFERFFDDKIIKNIKGVNCIRNIIVYNGSQIHDILKGYYSKYDYLSIKDFHIEYISKV